MKKMEKILLEEKQRLVLIAAQEQDIEIDTDGDEFDEIQGNFIKEIHNQLNTRNAHKIIQIEEALKRIEDKTYGLCQDCGEQIPEKRLLFNPYIATCVDCAEDREIEEKQRKREQS
jgi:DnaK suppressor protein